MVNVFVAKGSMHDKIAAMTESTRGLHWLYINKLELPCLSCVDDDLSQDQSLVYIYMGKHQ